MQKIPTLFKRDPENMKQVLNEVTPGCEWVLAGEGKATRKYDGTCVRFDGQLWWARREIKPGKSTPQNFQLVSVDPNTGKSMGWEPIEQSGFARWHAEALENTHEAFVPGTYELCGPKVNGNPERFEQHILISHASAEKLDAHSLDFEGLRETVIELYDRFGVEGLVWHHPDGRMAKLKARDFQR